MNGSLGNANIYLVSSKGAEARGVTHLGQLGIQSFLVKVSLGEALDCILAAIDSLGAAGNITIKLHRTNGGHVTVFRGGRTRKNFFDKINHSITS